MAKTEKIISGWKLWRQTLVAYKLRFWRYVGIVLIIIIPVTVLNAIANGDPTVAAYGSLATLIMNTALIYAVIYFDNKPDEKPKFRELFYNSSIVFVRYIIVGVVLALMLIPAALGLGLIGLGANTTGAPALGELLLLSVIGLIIAIPSVYLLIRNGLALITVYENQRWPGSALKKSRELTKNHFWSLLVRYLLMAVGLFISVLPVSIICIGLYAVTQARIFLSIYQIASAAIVLPLLYIYLHQVHQELVVSPKESTD